MSQSDVPNGIAFSFFASLVREVAEKCKPKSISTQKSKARKHGSSDPALAIFKGFIDEIRFKHEPLPPGTTSVVFRFLFPEEDTKRKYNLGKMTLSYEIASVLGIDEARLQNEEGYSGCLGGEVQKVIQEGYSKDDGDIGVMDIFCVDDLLNELASTSPWSDSSLRRRYPKDIRRTRKQILRALYRRMPPLDAAVLTQIILKDLKPLLYPHIETDYTTALRDFNTKSLKMLTKEQAIYAWDPSSLMNRAYRAQADLDAAARAFECGEDIAPVIGTPIGVPKSQKGHSCKHAMSLFKTSKRVWAETKYDGERAQIHVQIDPGRCEPQIKIFSKSRRDSTKDRLGVHDIVLSCLGFGGGHTVPRIKKNVILDAEMVACDGTKITEFWRIRKLIKETAEGVRGETRKRLETQDPGDCASQSSLLSETTEDMHLAVVFFDIMFLDDENLVTAPYWERRERLENLIVTTPAMAMLAERWPINIENSYSSRSDSSDEDDEASDRVNNDNSTAVHALCDIFAERIALCEEGLVLKGAESGYNDWKKPWVKLKKDYIPKLGDTLDLVLLGAAWEAHRAQELRVPPSALTTFYIGAVTNKEQVENDPSVLPHFFIYFTTSYGMSRAQLEELNFWLKNDDPIKYNKNKPSHSELSYTFDLFRGITPPEILLREPLAAELFGDRFDVPQGCAEYQLRWPRMPKVYRPGERSWRDCVSLQELRGIARKAMGRDSSEKEIRDVVKGMWHHPASPGVRDENQRNARLEFWRNKIAAVDHIELGRGKKRAKTTDSKSPLKRRKVVTHTVETNASLLGAKTSQDTSITLLKASPMKTYPVKSKAIHAVLDIPICHLTTIDLHVEHHDTVPLRATTNQPTFPSRMSQSAVSAHAVDENSEPISGTSRVESSDYGSTRPASCSTKALTRIKYPSPPTSPIKPSPKSSRLPHEDTSIRLNAPSSKTFSVDRRRVEVEEEFFREAMVWMAKPRLKLPGGSPWKKLIPPHQRIHSLQSLLAGCGWSPATTASAWRNAAGDDWIKRGIIFVDPEDEAGKNWLLYAIKSLEECPPSRHTATSRLPIWIFNHRTLLLEDKLLERQAIRIFC